MWISELQLEHIRGFATATTIHLSKNINLLVGRNNSGKSTILKTLYSLQVLNILKPNIDIRIGAEEARGHIYLNEITPDFASKRFHNDTKDSKANISFNFKSTQALQLIQQSTNQVFGFKCFSTTEPDNLFYPFFSKRKVPSYNEDVRKQFAFSVLDTFANLPAKIDRLTSNNYPKRDEFNVTCREVLGFEVSAIQSDNGKKVGYYINGFASITLEEMGDGVPHLVGLIADLCLAEGKIFLIEELENDIHPEALKSLLKLIIEKSEKNQFIISTHSNM